LVPAQPGLTDELLEKREAFRPLMECEPYLLFMFGCLLALLWQNPNVKDRLLGWARPWFFAGS
jgi:hypothetical protein